MSVRTTIKTIERGVRYKSPSGDHAVEPVQHFKQQLNTFLKHSEDEKTSLHRLNDRLSVYVDRVKALEAENFKLLREIQDIQSRWGDGSKQIKEQYERDLYDLRARIDDTANLRALADIRSKRSAYEAAELQRRMEDEVRVSDADKYKILNLQQEIEQTTASLSTLNKAVQDEKADIIKYQQQRDDLWHRLGDLTDKLDDEILRRVSIEYNNQTLREHIEFLAQIHEREMLEMSQLANALPFNDQVEFYKDQLKRVISNIRKDYEQLHLDQTRELQEWMHVKTEEIAALAKQREPSHDLELELHVENAHSLRSSYDTTSREMDDLRKHNDLLHKRLQDLEERLDLEKRRIGQTLDEQSLEYNKLNDNIGVLLNDYNHLNSNKASLEYEIQVYKRLLDSQLNRLGGSVQTSEQRENQSSISSGAFGGKVQNKKEKKGSVGISDAAPDGKYIAIENTGGANNVVADLGGWLIKRKVDSGAELTFKIPSGTLLVPGSSIKLWSNSQSRNRTGNDLVNSDLDNWGIGISSITRLLNASQEERSSFSQQITFANY